MPSVQPNSAVAVQVDLAAAGGEHHRAARRAVHDQRSERTAAVADDVDRDRRDPRRAIEPATTNGLPFLLSVNPWP